MSTLPKTSKEAEPILANIKEEANKLVDINGLPIVEFRLVHEKCATREEGAGYFVNVDNFVVIDASEALQEMCEAHGVYSARYPKESFLHKKIGS